MLVWPLVLALLGQGDTIHVSKYTFNDWSAYSRSVGSWLDGGQLYFKNEDGIYHGSYLYPPFALPIFFPFAELHDFEAAAVIFGLFSLFLLWVGVESVIEELGYRLSVLERILLFFALFGFHPALWDFKWAQVSKLLAAILCFSFYTHERGARGKTASKYLSGVLTTLGSAVKLFFAPAGAHLLRDKRRFVAAIATLGGLLLFSVLVFGIGPHREYLNVLTWGKGWGVEQNPPFYRLTAYYRPKFLLDQFFATLGLELPEIWMLIATALGILAVIWLTLAARNEPDAAHPTFALGIAVVPLFAPRAYTHDLTILLLPAIILLAFELDRDGGYPWIPVLAVLLLHLHPVGVKAAIELVGQWNAVLLQPGVYGTYLLVGLAAVRVAEYTPLPVLLARYRPDQTETAQTATD